MLPDTDDAETNEENTTVHIMNIHVLSKQAGGEKDLTLPKGVFESILKNCLQSFLPHRE